MWFIAIPMMYLGTTFIIMSLYLVFRMCYTFVYGNPLEFNASVWFVEEILKGECNKDRYYPRWVIPEKTAYVMALREKRSDPMCSWLNVSFWYATQLMVVCIFINFMPFYVIIPTFIAAAFLVKARLTINKMKLDIPQEDKIKPIKRPRPHC